MNLIGIVLLHPRELGFIISILTHNVFKGNMDVWFKFYGDLFNFKEIRFSIFKVDIQVYIAAL